MKIVLKREDSMLANWSDYTIPNSVKISRQSSDNPWKVPNRLWRELIICSPHLEDSQVKPKLANFMRWRRLNSNILFVVFMTFGVIILCHNNQIPRKNRKPVWYGLTTKISSLHISRRFHWLRSRSKDRCIQMKLPKNQIAI